MQTEWPRYFQLLFIFHFPSMVAFSHFHCFFFLKSCLKIGGAAYARVRFVHESLQYLLQLIINQRFFIVNQHRPQPHSSVSPKMWQAYPGQCCTWRVPLGKQWLRRSVTVVTRLLQHCKSKGCHLPKKKKNDSQKRKSRCLFSQHIYLTFKENKGWTLLIKLIYQLT